MPKKKNVDPKPIDWSGNLADFKNVVQNNKPTASIHNVIPGGTKVPNPSKGADTGMFAGSGTPLGTSIAGSNLSKGNVANAALSAIMLGGGAGPIPKIASKVGAVVETKAANLGVSAGVDYLGGAMSRISSKLPAVGGQIKQTAGTIYTEFGVTPGKQAFIQMPVRTSNQIAGTIKGMVTKQSNIASNIAGYSTATAKEGIKTGAKIGGAAAGAAGTALGFILGKKNKDK